MAVDAFIYFIAPDGFTAPEGETEDKFFKDKKAFELKDFSYDLEHAHTIGSATKGAASGKVKFGEFTIKKPTDKASCNFFMDCVAGAHYKTVAIAIRKSGATASAAGAPYLEFLFGNVFVTKVDWSGPGDEGPEESITFTFGRYATRYRPQNADGSMGIPKIQGWDQQTNKSWTPDSSAFDKAESST
jgi:type VI secretion system secreted protein Hcp